MRFDYLRPPRRPSNVPLSLPRGDSAEFWYIRGDGEGLKSDDCLLPELLGRLLSRLLGREPAAERGVSMECSESAVDGRERGDMLS